MRLGHVRQHRRHHPVLQTEAQEGEGCNGELTYSKVTLLGSCLEIRSEQTCLFNPFKMVKIDILTFFCFSFAGVVIFAVQGEDAVKIQLS